MDLAVATYKRINETGEIEIVECATGNVLSQVATYEVVSRIQGRYVISPGVISVITNLVRSHGLTLIKISKMEGMPPISVLYAWKAASEEFRIALREAEKDRADIFHDKLLDAAETIDGLGKDEVPSKKLLIDTLFRLAEADNSEKYKTKASAGEGSGGSVVIRVDTGIKREPLDGGEDSGDTVVIKETDYKEVQNG